MSGTVVETRPEPPTATAVEPRVVKWLPALPPVLQRAFWSDRFWGWAAPLLITLVGGVARFWRLDQPHKLIFDETYYVKEGVSYLGHGYELALRESILKDPDKRNEAADKLFTHGHLDIYGTAPDRVVHPMVGKWMIAFGEWLFGPTSSWGWRFSAALCGTLAILMIGRIARRLFGSTLLGAIAALLLAVDGMEFVLSRTSILDIFVMFWALAAFGCLLIDRDHARARVLERGARPGSNRRMGPWLGLRPWRIAAVVCLALCTGVKWSGLYFAVVFLLMSVLWDCSARRRAGLRRWFVGAAVLDAVPAGLTTLLVLPTVYVATWAGWFASKDAWNRQWAASVKAAPGWGWVPDSIRSLWHYHVESWQFHTTLVSPHSWQSNPWTWIVQGRPTLFFNDIYTNGKAGCHVASCNQMITPLGNPAIWWGSVFAIAVVLFRWALARDWRAGAVLSGLAAGYLPWFLYQYRTIFEFYAVAFAPWVVLAVTYCLGMIIGPSDAPPARRQWGVLVAGGYVLVAVLLFWFFYPILAGRVVPSGVVTLRHWITSWY